VSTAGTDPRRDLLRENSAPHGEGVPIGTVPASSRCRRGRESSDTFVLTIPPRHEDLRRMAERVGRRLWRA
jgi:hypothetical protein